jgi:hypothetical protein
MEISLDALQTNSIGAVIHIGSNRVRGTAPYEAAPKSVNAGYQKTYIIIIAVGTIQFKLK